MFRILLPIYDAAFPLPFHPQNLQHNNMYRDQTYLPAIPTSNRYAWLDKYMSGRPSTVWASTRRSGPRRVEGSSDCAATFANIFTVPSYILIAYDLGEYRGSRMNLVYGIDCDGESEVLLMETALSRNIILAQRQAV